jgi:hypothetical protein
LSVSGSTSRKQLTDPAVVGVDATGKFVMPVQDYGGANELARNNQRIGHTCNYDSLMSLGKRLMNRKNLHLTIQNPRV